MKNMLYQVKELHHLINTHLISHAPSIKHCKAAKQKKADHLY
jgi:hypothetical protein